MDEYSITDVQKELESVRIKLVENARLQLIAVEHSDLVNRILHRSTLHGFRQKADLLHGYEHALEGLLNTKY